MYQSIYLTYFGHQLSCKNKLEKDVLEYLKKIDRTLINSEISLKSFQNDIIANIEQLNEAHKRCTPIKPHFFKIDNKDYHLSGVHFVSFKIYSVNKILS